MRYEDLRGEQNERGVEYTYKVRRGRNRIYGGKVIENVCQAVARCIIGEQMLKIAKKYRVVLTVHDSVVCCVPKMKSKKRNAISKGVCVGYPTGLRVYPSTVNLVLPSPTEIVNEPSC